MNEPVAPAQNTRCVPAMMTQVRVIVALVVACMSAQEAFAANRYDPRLRFRAIPTAHFDIYFHQGEEALARRVARIAEEVASRMSGELGRPRSRVYVILVDQSDVSNGWATPVPYNVIELNAASPRPASTIGNTDDWIRLVFTHEYTHIVHLEKSRGWIGGLRHVFGANPALFPNLFLPQWQVEGLATYSESALTGRGRVRASDFRLMIDRAAAARRLEPLDRVNGGLVDWPGGSAAYLYGAYFHQYLADRYGAESLAKLATVTSGRVPFFGSRGFKKVYGRSLGALWKDFEASARSSSNGPAGATTRLTSEGFGVAAPHFAEDGRLFYSVSSPHDFPRLMELGASGSVPRKVVNAYGSGQITSAAQTMVYDQLEFVRNVGLQSDLYASNPGGAVRRLTHQARASEPDVAADGRRTVCIVQQADRRVIAELDLAIGGAPVSLISEPLTDYSSPRWSPDGASVVAERRRVGGPSEIVVVNAGTRTVKTLVSSDEGRNVQPVWLSREAVAFASDRRGAGFEIYSVDIATGRVRRLLDAGEGAQNPAVSPDGRRLVFVAYTADGYDLFAVDLGSAEWASIQSQDPMPAEVSGESAAGEPAPRSRDSLPAGAYSPWRTLAPRWWTPLIASDNGEIVAGAATVGSDVLGRHTYSASTAWAASRRRPDWQVGYAYDRWWPALFADMSDDTDPWRTGEVRSRELNAGAVFPVRRVRWTQATLAAVNASTDGFTCPACSPAIDTSLDRVSVRLGSVMTSAKAFGYSISREQGASMRATMEVTRRAIGSSGNATSWTLDARGYRRALARHGVIAARFAAAGSFGEAAVRRVFTAAGSGPQPLGFVFGADAIGLLRGFDEDAVAAPRAAVANVDYRFPLASVQRGIGTLPLFLRTVHAAFFVDVGNAWDGRFDSADIRTSIGGELSADTVLGYAVPVTFVSGLAWRHDPAGGAHGLAYFTRVGWAF